MNLVTGDTHGRTDIHKFGFSQFPMGRRMTLDDNLFVAGDFGLWWDESKEDIYWREFIIARPWMTCIVDGNHENFDRWLEFPVEEWNGGRVRRLAENIIWLQRGEVFDIYGVKFFVFGGATSIDKAYRLPGRSWWPQEIPSQKEVENAFTNLEANNWEVDFVITHTCPHAEVPTFSGSLERLHDPVSYMLQEFKDRLKFKKWYFGHFHKNKEVGRFHCVYNDIVQMW